MIGIGSRVGSPRGLLGWIICGDRGGIGDAGTGRTRSNPRYETNSCRGARGDRRDGGRIVLAVSRSNRVPAAGRRDKFNGSWQGIGHHHVRSGAWAAVVDAERIGNGLTGRDVR